jgi:putative hydrolase of the HAD superfamily
MKRAIPVTTLFIDIGGGLLTKGWNHHARKRAARHFKLAWAEMEDRHQLDTPMFVQIAEGLGIRSILHRDYKSTRAKLAALGLQNDEGVIHETN